MQWMILGVYGYRFSLSAYHVYLRERERERGQNHIFNLIGFWIASHPSCVVCPECTVATIGVHGGWYIKRHMINPVHTVYK